METLQILLQSKNFDVNFEFQGCTPLYVACFRTAKLLLQYPSVNVNKLSSGESPLHLAVKSSNAAMLKLLLDHKDILVNTLNIHNETALITGLRLETVPWDCINLLLGHEGIQTDKALFWAVKRSQESKVQCKELFDFIKYLCKKPDLDLNYSQPGGTLPILWAYVNSKEVFQVLLSHPRLDINSKDADGKSLLQVACDKSDTVTVLRMIDTPNIDVNILLSSGKTILHFFIELSNHIAIDKVIKLINTT
jgi:hypothetical protein